MQQGGGVRGSDQVNFKGNGPALLGAAGFSDVQRGSARRRDQAAIAPERMQVRERGRSA
ncbi:hypothetical protein PT2222_160026 [Paraburkholderia tropica]